MPWPRAEVVAVAKMTLVLSQSGNQPDHSQLYVLRTLREKNARVVSTCVDPHGVIASVYMITPAENCSVIILLQHTSRTYLQNSHPMAEFDLALDQETDFALDKDELSAILDYLDVHCEHDWTALQVSASTATGNKTKKPLRSSRFDILSLRQEVLELQDQLQILQEKYNLHRPIKSIRESSAQDWALIAYRERVSCTTAIRVNTDLQKRVLANRRLFDRIVKLCCRQQAQAMPKSVEIDLKCMPLANTAQVYHVLQVCLEYRIQGQLDSIVDRCSDSGHELQRHQWRLFPTGNRCLGVKFQESVAMPFSAKFVRDALLHGPSIGALMNNAIGSCTTNVRSRVKEFCYRLLLTLTCLSIRFCPRKQNTKQRLIWVSISFFDESKVYVKACL